jgi:D-3-phosphoglycerate dehydrogenase / 2-oxoglutarate reductase
MKIVRTDAELTLPRVDAALRAQGHDLVQLPDGIGEAALCEAVREADLLLMCYTPISARVIENAPRLKGIVKYGVGIDAIDISAAMRAGIPVVNIPAYAENTVAEGAFALLLALVKRLKPLLRTMARDGWAWPTPEWLSTDLAGKTVALIGAGRIGRHFAQMARGFDMRAVAYDPYVDAGMLAALHIEKIESLHAALAIADVVSIHCVLNDETRHLIDAAALSAMKPSAVLVNVSRGASVDEAALAKALLERRIAGAALDVLSVEPFDLRTHPLRELATLDHVLISPHLTFYSHEAMARLEAETLERCAEILEGKPVLVKSHDPRLRAQTTGVRFG